MNDWVLLMGAGDLAERLYPLLKSQDTEVLGARRNPKDNVPFQQVKADATKVEDWLKLLKHKPREIVITLTPTEFSDEGYEQGYVKPALALAEALKSTDSDYRPFTLFVSSTSVYGERMGEWVNEATPAKPDTFSGKRLLQAEAILQDADCNLCVVRFAGIYGPGREGMVARLISGDLKITPAWLNRIHVRDCVGTISHLLDRHRAELPVEPVYLACDNLPVRQEEFVRGLADKLGIDTDSLPATGQIGPRGNKRCNNALLLESGYRFIFPTWKEGYEAL